jgi:hypothetical protein
MNKLAAIVIPLQVFPIQATLAMLTGYLQNLTNTIKGRWWGRGVLLVPGTGQNGLVWVGPEALCLALRTRVLIRKNCGCPNSIQLMPVEPPQNWG